MPRSRINANFIDKTSSIVANILLRIIPTTSGEKKAFTYYRDVVLSITRKKRDVRDRKNQIFEINSRLVKVKFGDRTIPSVVYPRLMQPQMLQLSILVLSERFRIAGQSYSTSTNRRHGGRSTTPRNQQHKNFVINYPFPYRYRG
ncbi:hypothetical protein C4D60_Mb00t01480 [Musa balbisiana]|uniref:Uncharacterized protein n=1 Tax=Musa balbisiana TaxID=52838 RepID=A0A4S8I3I8_MUSBA|nr:hypothetical protein C4D60_Mb00t11200 [Musa balbisiana]THU43174.1 hypothetical protein C4D60_Mb00t01480 [Musa balbisiana]